MTVKNTFGVHIPSCWHNNDRVQSGLRRNFLNPQRMKVHLCHTTL